MESVRKRESHAFGGGDGEIGIGGLESVHEMNHQSPILRQRDLNWAAERTKVVLEAHLKGLKEDWNEMDLFDKFSYILELPFEYLRILTIPVCEEQTYNKLVAMAHPFTVPLFFLWYLTKD